MIKIFPFRLDIGKEYNNRMYSVNSNDLKSAKFTFVITDNGIPLDLTGLTVRIAIRKPDKKAVWQDCTITNAPKGEVEVILDNQAYIKKGEHEAELMLYKGTDTVAITQKFYYRAAEGIMSDKSLKSETTLGPIDQKLAEVEETLSDIRKNGTGIDAEARQDIESVTMQLAKTSQNLKSDFKAEVVRLGNLQTFKDAIAKRYCKIAFFGDSITGSGDYIEVNDRWVEQSIKTLREAYPDVTFVYQNFGIGGRTLEQASSEGYISPDHFTASWATVSGTSWRDYVKQYNAHLVFIAFGMNVNASGAGRTSYYLQILKSFFGDTVTNPSLILLSNLIPNKSWASADWNERIISSRQTVLFSKKNDITLLDVYNRYRILVDGKDESNYTLARYENGEGTVANGSLRKTIFNTKNFKFTQNITLEASNVYTLSFRNHGQIDISATQIIIKDIEVISLNGETGGKQLIVELGDNLKITLGGIVYYDSPYYAYVQDAPVIFGWKTGNGAVSELQITNYVMADSTGGFTVDDLYGTYIEGDTALKLPFGGNGVNHPSSVGYNFFYVPLIYDFINKFNAIYKKESMITKTITFDLDDAGAFMYGSIGKDSNFPYLVGALENPSGTVYTEKKDIPYSTDNIERLKDTEYFIRRTAGIVQIILRPQAINVGWKFTTNVTL